MRHEPGTCPGGAPTGGQFAPSRRGESLIVGDLVQHGDGHIGLTADGKVVQGYTCPTCGNGYKSQTGLDVHDCIGDEQCAAIGCGATLDDGEGWDGYCGQHADLVVTHQGGGHDTSPDLECPECE